MPQRKNSYLISKRLQAQKKKQDDLNKLTIAAKAYAEALKDQLDAERESIAIQVKSIGQGLLRLHLKTN
jgi:phage gp46-like protein